MIKRVVLATLLGVLLILGVNTLRQGSKQLQVPAIPPIAFDANLAAQHLAGALRFRTIASAEVADQNSDQFLQLHAYLQSTYPRAHAAMTREVVGQYSLLYRWQGSDANARPIMLMAHQDVVPIAAGTETSWQVAPFDGTIRNGYVWGRGAWDNKGNLLAMLEAIERLAAAGFQPRQTIYLAAGADEEVGGKRGAQAIAALLQARGVRLDYVLDEGLLITDGMMKGLQQPAALIGIAEKGYATLLLEMDGAPGHSSMPPAVSLIGSMSGALARLEAHPLPAQLGGAARAMLTTLAPEMTWPNRLLLSNLWLTAPLVSWQLQKTPSTAAMLRTTTALTMVHAGNQDNVLPGTIAATVNFRLLPGDTEAAILAHVHAVIANDAIRVRVGPNNAPASRLADTASVSYRAINRSVREVFPNTLVAPGLMIGATDARYMESISDNVYRFSPVRALPADLARFHGTDERISIQNFGEMIQFYHRLLHGTA